MKETIKHNLIPALIAILIGAPIAWVAANRDLPYETIGGITIPAKIKIDGTYKIQWKLKPNADVRCPGVVYSYLRDSGGAIFVATPRPAAFGLLPVKTRDVIVVYGGEHKLDPTTALGPAEIYTTVTFVCNFAQWLWPLEMDYGPVKTEIIQ